LGEVFDFNSREGFDGNVWKGFPRGSKEVFIMLDAPIGVEAANGVHFVDMIGVLTQIFQVSINVKSVGVGGFFAATEGAKLARQNADIGLIDMDVAVEKGLVVEPRCANHVGEASNFIQIGMSIEHHAFFKGQRQTLHHVLDKGLKSVAPAG
tara:strand:+ start:40 stop:495 length:456 start_codon:yes stop_codon:yes gene_type:complete